MRRASPTGTGTPAAPGRRWTATGIAGADAGAAAVGFGGLYAAGLLLTGEEVAAGTKVRGVATGGMSRDEARQTLDRVLGPAALGLSLDSAATADRAARTGSGPTCEPRSPLEGFDVAVDRVSVQGGEEVGRETMKTRHTPRDRVTCGA
ncbi:hypothetical protein [Streptomyces sp. NBC_00273]|uniref:hypothetical protein n=1 Tax=Streptomyces sp. NBC_00273 TaxID=2903644 RepID=UPI002E2B8C65|nr:hypothetical protein [Streptomyces sp. NBC_00273]